MTNAHLEYEKKRIKKFYKYVRIMRGLSYKESDKLSGNYNGWTKRAEEKGHGKISSPQSFYVYHLYKITEKDAAEFLKKYPRNKKFKQFTF